MKFFLPCSFFRSRQTQSFIYYFHFHNAALSIHTVWFYVHFRFTPFLNFIRLSVVIFLYHLHQFYIYLFDMRRRLIFARLFKINKLDFRLFVWTLEIYRYSYFFFWCDTILCSSALPHAHWLARVLIFTCALFGRYWITHFKSYV